MKNQIKRTFYMALIITPFQILPAVPPKSPFATMQEKIEKTFAQKADAFSDEKVIKISVPRTDFKVSLDNRILDPFMGIGGWLAFQQTGKPGEALLMGDLALRKDEVQTALATALEQGINVTALHNHFINSRPTIFFMHVSGTGNVDQLAAGAKKTIEAIKNIKRFPTSYTPFPTKTLPNTITPAPLEKILQSKGAAKDGMIKFVFGRTTQAHDAQLGKNMGVNTWVAFNGIDQDAMITGDFALLEDELQPVLKTLTAANINIVAIHNHMTHENPRIIFVHFWAKGASIKLAQGIKNALDKTATLKK